MSKIIKEASVWVLLYGVKNASQILEDKVRKAKVKNDKVLEEELKSILIEVKSY